jgi:hypothetical protein
VLGDGQQIVVNGTHPDTHRPYFWHGGEPGPKLRREDLPLITAETAAAFIAAAAKIMRNAGWTEIESKKTNGKSGDADHGSRAGRAESASIRERAYAQAALDGCAEELAGTAAGDRNNILYKKSFRVGTMVARNWIARSEAEAALFDAAVTCGLCSDDGEAQTRRTIKSGLDDGATAPHPDLAEQTDDGEKWEDAAQPAPKLLIKSSGEFVAGFVPPEYVVVGLLQRRFFYSLTGQTGVGKTAIMLLLSASSALGWPVAGRETNRHPRALSRGRKCRMCVCAGSPSRTWILMSARCASTSWKDTFSLSKSLQLLRTEAEQHGGEFGMVVVDTGPFFERRNEDETNNSASAQILLSRITHDPGRAMCGFTSFHPTKMRSLIS